ncbi:MAG: LysM peptidoglycan-binding domain-containing protein [Rikenellaceae bacterium]
MKRFILTCLCTLCAVTIACAVTKSQVVVYINGQKYYIHTVEPKETIYSISKAYDVPQQIIIDLNSAELKAGENIKIPYELPAQKELSAREIKRTFSKHKVEKGETLYSISRKYEISIDTIIEDNPEIDPIALPSSYNLLIRKKMKGKNSQEQSEAQWVEYKSDLNLTTQSDGYRYHIVGKGETIYSLSRQSGLSEEEFALLNNLSDGLKAGAIIKMPADSQEIEEVTAVEEESYYADQIKLRSLQDGDTLRIALFLPLSRNSKASRQFAEFYNGFEAGLDTVKSRWGRNIELSVYDTERSIRNVTRAVNSEEFEGVNLIVGPIYEDLLAPVIEYAEKNHIPVVSPLAALKQSQSSVLFQMAPPTDTRYQKVKEMISDTTRRITLIYTENTDSLFEQNIMTLMGDREYQTHHYEYANPTQVAEMMKEEEESAGDLSKYINNHKDNTIVVMSSSETDVDRVLSALSSAQINIVARGGRKPKYEVLGNSEWSRYNNIDRTILFKNNVVLISSYHAKRDDERVRLFDSNYIEAYDALPSLYAYRGYDAAMIFGEGIYSDMDNYLEGRLFTPIQSHYNFKSDPDTGVHTNVEWIKVNYKSNYKIIIE